MKHSFVVYGNPVPKGRPRLGRYGNVYTPRRTKTWETIVGWAYREGNGPFFTGDLSISYRFYMQDRKRVDHDNLEKAVTDALNGIAYEDDSQIVHWEGWKLIDRGNPRVEVEIAEVRCQT
jgi:crossover junction endodeoxyribonuclease RusA